MTRRLLASSLALPDDPAVLAYIAGVFDGEGFVTHRKWQGSETFIVGVSNTSEPLIDWLASFGGNKFTKRMILTGRHRNRVQVYEWRVQRLIDVHKLLISLEPYLIIKRAKALAAIRRCQDIADAYDGPHPLHGEATCLSV